MSYGLGQGLFQFPSNATGVTVTGYQVGTPTLDQLNQYLAQLPVTTPTEAAQVDPYLLQAAAIGASDGTSPIGVPSGPGTLPVSWLFIGMIALGLAFLVAAKK